MPQRGVQSNLMNTTEYITDNINNKLQVDVIYLDMKKAFDTINHEILAQKLCKLSMPINLFKSIMNFITNREYYLKIDNEISKHKFQPNTGIPQGSIIGPLLFNIYINDLPDTITDEATMCLMFCDDTKILRPMKDSLDNYELQQQINNVLDWCDTNKMKINETKTYQLSINKRSRKPILTYYFIDGTPIEKVSNFKDLGITFDDKMTFEPHRKNIHNTAMMMNNYGYRLSRQTGSTMTNLHFFNTYTRPIIEYGATIWNTNESQLTKYVEKILKIVTKNALGLPRLYNHPRYIPYLLRLQRLNMISMKRRFNMITALNTIRIMKNELKINFKHKLNNAQYGNDIRTRNKRIFYCFNLNRDTISYRLMKELNYYEDKINLENSTAVNKAAIKNELAKKQREENL